MRLLIRTILHSCLAFLSEKRFTEPNLQGTNIRDYHLHFKERKKSSAPETVKEKLQLLQGRASR